ncbi:Cupin 2 conserved barrel [Penicillium odoratum]|uniref:Cupin 2 conserved barrel n=1 Tax=Penicillium odoratum TaxID=1167516 RepID=UPI002549AB59|nr:Cupin 2 conserved barrel [Penicillium odoratum]KAJ5769071.1 Cupin 2 conserved barrel [Penicillium odoratum]
MAPCKPRTFTAGQDPLTKFDGAISVRNLPRPADRLFLFHGIMRPSRGIYAKLIATGQKPPTHFHPTQWEFFRVLRGNLTIDINGRPVHRTPADGEMAVAPYTHHVIYGTPGTEMNEVEFEVSGSDLAVEDEQGPVMDQSFFENWYGYQEDVFQRGEKLDLIQVLSVNTTFEMFDAGGTYLSPPWWVTFRSWVGLLLGIMVGRWIGGLLGYAPFYPEWTTDWEKACQAMEQSWFHRRFADPHAQERACEMFRDQLEDEAKAAKKSD